tara:strand:- start:3651 stop:4460 length:810 start_codon:yes stop_codon:yes gene_type:complete
MVVFPNAKINLGLHIKEKREDGYHNIESVLIPIPITDALEITKNKKEKTEFSCSGLKIPPDGKQNLVERAFFLIREEYKIPNVDLDLLKNIPTGAGLGGGSADAAQCLIGLNNLFNLQISEKKLLNLSAKLGADCSFFIKNKIMHVEGIGNKFTEIDINLSEYYFVVIYPEINVSTVDAYKETKPKRPIKSVRDILKQPIETWRKELKNDFENSVFKQHPKIRKAKQDIYNSGAIYASMSGSGSAIFGIFKNSPKTNFEHIGRCWCFKL